MSSQPRAQCVVATRQSRGPLPFVLSGVDIKKLGSVSDSKPNGLDKFSIQQNLSGVGMGWQDVLEAFPDHLTWKVDVFSEGPVLQKLYQTDILYLNIETLRQGLVLVVFRTGKVGDQFRMSMSITTIDGIMVYSGEMMIPGKYVADIISAYTAFVGQGDGSSANFGSDLDAVVTHSTDASVTDLQAIGHPYAEGGESVQMFGTNEGGNTYQQVTVDNGVEVAAKVAVGPYIV